MAFCAPQEAKRSAHTHDISRSHCGVAGGACERLGLGDPGRHILGLAVAAAVEREGRARPRVRLGLELGVGVEVGVGVGLGVEVKSRVKVGLKVGVGVGVREGIGVGSRPLADGGEVARGHLLHVEAGGEGRRDGHRDDVVGQLERCVLLEPEHARVRLAEEDSHGARLDIAQEGQRTWSVSSK